MKQNGDMSLPAAPARRANQTGKHPRPCFLLARPRSGATVFNRMLGSHPKIVPLGEVFNESNEHSYFHFLRDVALTDPDALFPSHSTQTFIRYLDSCRSRALHRKPHCEFMILSVKYDQAHLLCDPWWKLGQLPKILFLIRDKKWKVLDIHRDDIFKQCVSNQVAIQTNIYHSTALEPGQEQSAKVHIDPVRIQKDIAATKALYAAFAEHFKDRPSYRTISYEKMFAQDDIQFSKPLLDEMAKFLGLKNTFDPSPKLQKLLKDDVFAYIDNADEIRGLGV